MVAGYIFLSSSPARNRGNNPEPKIAAFFFFRMRNTLLRLALTLEMDFEQCQQLLKAGSAAQLTSSRLRDRIIMVGLLNQEPLDEISRTLDEQGFIDLYAKG